MKRFGMAIGFILIATAVQAQPVTGYTVKFSNQGAPAPFMTTTLPTASWVCGQPKLVVAPPIVNASKLAVDDPADVTKDCVYVDNGTGPLLALPFSVQVYVATIASVDVAGTSADSAVSNPFSRPGTVAPVPTGFRVGK